MINTGIVGGSGYTAGELIRLLLNHPKAKIDFVYSTSRGGEPVSAVHRDLAGETEMAFSSDLNPDIDLLFLCTGHGNSTDFLKAHPLPPEVKIIDLSRDFRLSGKDTFGSRTFTYGLPELQKDAIKNARNIANPGCFATAIQLALLPLARATELNSEVHIHGITGSTGAGSSLSDTSHFSWRHSNVSIYKALEHQHIAEIKQGVCRLHPSFDSALNFIPVRGSFSRGIFISAYLNTDISLHEAQSIFSEFYDEAPFVHHSPDPLHLKQIVNTNKCLLHLQKKEGKLLVTTIIDNLLKGASGQAVQNMNLMFGLEEETGLNLKATYF